METVFEVFGKLEGNSVCRVVDNEAMDVIYFLFCTSQNTTVFYISKNKKIKILLSF